MAITRAEMIVGSVLCALVVIPAVTALGFQIARADRVSFNEYWSGLEKSADRTSTTCTRDGSCRHSYECDPYLATEHYTVQVPYSATETYTTSDGRTSTRTVTKYRTETRTRQVTRYHQCPYVDREYTYQVSDTLGNTYTIASHWFPENPSQHRWRDDRRGLPDVPSGAPREWEAVKDRIDSGRPGGVTTVHSYRNYLLASQQDILNQSSDAIDKYRRAKLMPAPVKGVYDRYRADKVYFVGAPPAGPSTNDWQDAVLRFNGTFGSERQGDLHLVIVTSPEVKNPDEYAQALRAYWQSPRLGKDALSKNGYVVVVGVDGATTGATDLLDSDSRVTWARGFSGMPEGNEGLDVAVREQLPGTVLTPDLLVGQPDAMSRDGAIGDLLLAKEGGFDRVEMKKFDYLFEQIQPSTAQKIVILLIGFLLALGVWAALAAMDLRFTPSPRDAR